MQAIVVHTFGDPGRLQIEAIDTPRPGPGELTINVTYAGVGLVDALMRQGAFAMARLPLVPGIEVAGTVRELGPGTEASGLVPGQRVAALLTDFRSGGLGGYAEVARAPVALAVPLDDGDDLAVAAATLVNGATAVLAMEGLPAGAEVAISGASGGLGQRLIAAARAAGAASVIAVSANTGRAAAMRRAGATRLLSPAALADANAMADGLQLHAAFDTVGGELRGALLQALRPQGRLLLLGNASGQDLPLSGDAVWLRSLRVEGLTIGGPSPLASERVARAARQALDQARQQPPAFSVLPLREAAEAHRLLEARQGPGKLVLKLR